MKNGPARERQQHRSRSAYCRSGKKPYIYPGWVVNRQPPPREVCVAILNRFKSEGWRVPALIMQGARYNVGE